MEQIVMEHGEVDPAPAKDENSFERHPPIPMAFAAKLSAKAGTAILWAASYLPGGRALLETKGTQVPVTFLHWFSQKILGINGSAYWPVHPSSSVSYVRRIRIGVETSPGWSAGCMIHGVNGIIIGDYTQISQNVAILSGNHDPYFLRRQISSKPICIGRYCLLGFNSVILPGVVLGDFTIVGANAVVTRSFEEGYVVLGGAPARILKRLEPARAEFYRSKHEYHGYIPAAKFAEFERRHLELD